MPTQILIVAGALIFGLLGTVHLAYTFFTGLFSPRDAAGTPGALEAALVGAPVSVQHIVRPFDPCMVCTVH